MKPETKGFLGMPRATGVVVSGVVGNALGVTPAVHAVFGLFLIPISQEFGWARAEVSAVFAIMAVITAICFPILGGLSDRYGGRRILLIGNLSFACSIALLSVVPGNLMLFYLLFALIGLTSSLPSNMMYARMVSNWYDSTRARMLGIVGGVGNGAGATLMPIIAGLLMAVFGWRGAYFGIALIVAGLGFPVLYLWMHDAPRSARAPSHPHIDAATLAGDSLAQAIRNPVYWMLMVAIGLGAGCMTAVFAHVIPVLAEHGVSAAVGTAVVSTFALVCAAWQVGLGWLLDHSRRPQIAAPFYALPVIGLYLLTHDQGIASLLLAGAMMGIGLGTQFSTLPFFVSRYFGLKSYGAIIGIVYSVVMLAQGLTPGLMDMVFDRTRSYQLAVQAIQIALIAGGLLLLLLPAYRYQARKRDVIEATAEAAAH